MTELLCKRIWPSPAATIGALYVDGASQCFSLEPSSAQGKGPIPAGTYQVVLLPSPHFEQSTDPWVQKYAKAMPHLVDVPNFEYVMIHFGNLPADTEGCILVGNVRLSASEVGDSRSCFSLLYPKIAGPLNRGESVSIAIEDVPPSPFMVSDPEMGL